MIKKLNAFTIKNGKLIPPSMKKGWWGKTLGIQSAKPGMTFVTR